MEEYEIVPLSPLRKLEKRIEKLESSISVDVKDFFKEIVDIVKMNQEIVTELAKANDAMRIELFGLTRKLEVLIKKFDEFLSYLKATEGETGESVKESDLMKVIEELSSRVEELERRIGKLPERRIKLIK